MARATRTVTSNRWSFPLSLLAGVLAFGLVPVQRALVAGQAARSEVTFTKDVAPILQRSCQSCHRPDGMAPMSLLTYEEVRPWASAIKRRTTARQMPPWFIERNIGIQKFKDDPSLSDEEIRRIAHWVDSGAPRGNPADLPPARQFAAAGAWTIGTPDLVMASPVITVKAVAPDLQADYGITPIGLTEPRYIKAVQVREVRLSEREVAGTPAGSRAALNVSVIHHATIQARTEVDDENDQPDNEVGRGGEDFNLVHELGQNATIYPDEVGVLLPPNALLSWRVHTHSKGKEVQVRLDVGFKLHPPGYKPKHVVRSLGSSSNYDLDIPAGQDNLKIDAYTVLRTPGKLVMFEPHMHASGKRMCVLAIFPNGARQTLNCAGYDHNWVKVYAYDDDVAPLLPAYTILHITGWYDNSTSNPRNADPRNWKGFGNRSIDDMMIYMSRYIPLTEEEFKAEVAARQAKLRSRPSN
jgi:mono/diheme cytochrome c family protein